MCPADCRASRHQWNLQGVIVFVPKSQFAWLWHEPQSGVAPLAARGCLYDLDGGGIGLIIALALACVISTMLFLVFKPGWCDLLGNAVAACRHHIDAISIPTRRAIRVDRSLLCEVIARSPRLVQHITHRIVEISV
jgi:hypothetical protein